MVNGKKASETNEFASSLREQGIAKLITNPVLYSIMKQAKSNTVRVRKLQRRDALFERM